VIHPGSVLRGTGYLLHMTPEQAGEVAGLDDLFATPPQEFVRRRNALVKELKAAGERAAAERIAALKRPVVALWAVNQLARRHPGEVERYLEIQRSLGTVTGASALGELTGQRRRLVGRLTKRAREILEEADHAVTTQTMQKVGSILLAADTDEEQDLVRRGRLDREPTASGFGGIALDPGEEEGAAPDEESPAADREAEELEAQAVAAAEVADRLAEEAARLLQEADAAASEAREARKRADELRRDAKAARTKLTWR